jgi:hypothetical protein
MTFSLRVDMTRGVKPDTTRGLKTPLYTVTNGWLSLRRNGQEENGDREEDQRETDGNPQQSEI